MKAMILAAGRGERLRPLTDTTPKPLLQAGKHRLIEYTILRLVEVGVREIIINYAHLGEQFPKVLGDGSQYAANIQYSPEPEGRLETAGGIINTLPLLGKEPFITVNGDIWTDYPFEELTQARLADDQLCHLVLVMNPEHNPEGDFGLRSGYINQSTDRRYTYSGIGIYQPKMFADLPNKPTPLKPLLLNAIENRTVGGEIYYGEWSDIGTELRLQQLINQLS